MENIKLMEQKGFAIDLLARKIEYSLNKLTEYCGMTASQARIIFFLYENKDQEIFQTDIKNFVSVKDSTLSIMIDKMEMNGFINRTTKKSDLRYRRITLTEQGIDAYFKLIKTIASFEKELTIDMSIEETDLFHRLVYKAINNINKIAS